MSNSYGNIFVLGNYKGDLKGLATYLNGLQLGSSDCEFEFSDDAIFVRQCIVEDPTVFPEGDNDRLEFHAVKLSSYLTEGKLELVALMTDNSCTTWVERMIIHSNGSAERHRIIFSFGGEEIKRYSESYASAASSIQKICFRA